MQPPLFLPLLCIIHVHNAMLLYTCTIKEEEHINRISYLLVEHSSRKIIKRRNLFSSPCNFEQMYTRMNIYHKFMRCRHLQRAFIFIFSLNLFICRDIATVLTFIISLLFKTYTFLFSRNKSS